jgi:hypothetical protein
LYKFFQFLLFSSFVNGSISEYYDSSSLNNFNSYGAVGLIQMPSARMREAGSTGIVYSNFDPYQRIAMVANPFEWLEVAYQYTDIKGILYSDNFQFSGNQTYKDKGFDLKINIYKESKMIPEISAGFRDLAGTGLFASEYIALTKNLGAFDITIGGLWGAFYDDFKNPFIYLNNRFENRGDFGTDASFGGEVTFNSFFRGKNMGLFGGFEFFIPNMRNTTFKIEYDPTKYELEAFGNVIKNGFINYGFSKKINENFDVNISWVRGDTLSFNFSFVPSLGKKNGIIKKDKDRKITLPSETIKNVTSQNDRYYNLALIKYLNDEGFYLRSSSINADAVSISYAQTTHISYPRSYSLITEILDEISPDRIRSFNLIPVNAGYELSSITIPRSQYLENKKYEDYETLNKYIQVADGYNKTKSHDYRLKTRFPKIFTSLEPEILSHIGGPDRFYSGALTLNLANEILFNRSLNIKSLIRYRLADTTDVLEQPSDSILPHVRTDIIEYLKQSKGASLFRLQGNYFFRPHKNIFGKLSAGIFEEMFGGYGFELLYRKFNSNFAIGIEAWDVTQREYDQKLKFRDYNTLTGHATFYYKFTNPDILMKFSGGRYLAKDSGFTMDLSRRFKSGLKLGAFFSRTDISPEEFGEGSFDKGFYISIPLEIFSTRRSRQLEGFGLKPLTRDGAAKVLVGLDLWGVTEESNYSSYLRDIDDLF